MERFLTRKALKARWWEIPAAGVVLVVGAIGVDACRETYDPADPVIWLTACVAVMGTILLPLFFMARTAWRRRTAKKLAAALVKCRKESVPLADLDKLTGVRGAEYRIKALLAKGFLKGIQLDERRFCAWLDTDDEPLETDAAPAPEAAAQEPEDAYAQTLREIRRLNDEIADGPVSERIDRLETVTASIFSTIREQPRRATAARRFLNYYLPTTLKLLESYSLLERQSYQGENIQRSRRQIEDILEKLVHAVEQLQDKLFQPDALDIEAEIRAMDTMLSMDGLNRTDGRGMSLPSK